MKTRKSPGASSLDDPTPSSPNLWIITICRDNPEELRRTLRSIELQSSQPFRQIVVDGSSPVFSNSCKSIAVSLGATYVWASPEGTYPAMNIGLDLVPEEDYVWFLNASDRLASPDSLSKVVYRLNLEKTGPRNRVAWMLGRTVVSEKTQTYFLPLGESGAEFVKKLRSGKVGFPHSSTVANAGLLREIGTFAKKFNVANDYLMSLELNQVAGPPEIIDHPLSFYDQKGESGRRPLSTYTSKLFVRMGFFGPTFITREPQHALWATLRWLARASAASKTFWSFAKFLEWKKPQVHADWHFCKGKEQKTWPGCCEEFILG